MEEGDENIIVDNGSDPPLEFATISLGTNLGFSGGSNAGLRYASADAVLFLNNDVVFKWRGWLARIRDALEPRVLIGGLRFDRHADVDGEKFPYLDGWCLAGMREDLLALGGFDETLEEPAYYSDNLLCLEARAAGMTLREVGIGLSHLESYTSKPATNPSVQAATAANRARYVTRARELMEGARHGVSRR